MTADDRLVAQRVAEPHVPAGLGRVDVGEAGPPRRAPIPHEQCRELLHSSGGEIRPSTPATNASSSSQRAVVDVGVVGLRGLLLVGEQARLAQLGLWHASACCPRSSGGAVSTTTTASKRLLARRPRRAAAPRSRRRPGGFCRRPSCSRQSRYSRTTSGCSRPSSQSSASGSREHAVGDGAPVDLASLVEDPLAEALDHRLLHRRVPHAGAGGRSGRSRNGRGAVARKGGEGPRSSPLRCRR